MTLECLKSLKRGLHLVFVEGLGGDLQLVSQLVGVLWKDWVLSCSAGVSGPEKGVLGTCTELKGQGVNR